MVVSTHRGACTAREGPRAAALLGRYGTQGPPGFSGAWGAYIFPASNLILVSDINGGLFVIGYTPR